MTTHNPEENTPDTEYRKLADEAEDAFHALGDRIATTPDTEEIIREAVKSVTRDDDGLLDIGKHDHELLSDLLKEVISSHTTYWKEQLQKAREQWLREMLHIVDRINISTEIEFIQPKDQYGYYRCQEDIKELFKNKL